MQAQILGWGAGLRVQRVGHATAGSSSGCGLPGDLAGKPAANRGLKAPWEGENDLQTLGPAAMATIALRRPFPLLVGRRAGWGFPPAPLPLPPCRRESQVAGPAQAPCRPPTMQGVGLQAPQLGQGPEGVFLTQEHQEESHSVAHPLTVAHLLQEPDPMGRGHLAGGRSGQGNRPPHPGPDPPTGSSGPSPER